MDTIRPWLHIGKYRDTLNHALLRRYQIGAMPHPALWESLCVYYNEPVPDLKLIIL